MNMWRKFWDFIQFVMDCEKDSVSVQISGKINKLNLNFSNRPKTLGSTKDDP